MSNHNFREEQANMAAPFVHKMTFYVPERTSNITQQKNAAHIEYIGTRPGVELNDPLENHHDDASIHVQYADERPGSHGLFGASDERPDVKGIQMELANHNGLVWRSVLSLTEEDAARLGFTSKDKWMNALRSSVPQAAAHMGIPETNLRWVAAFHLEKGHPHAHLVIWEKKPVVRRGVMKPAVMNKMKQEFTREIYAEERLQMNQEKTAVREYMRTLTKTEMGKVAQAIKDISFLDKQVELEQHEIGAANGPIIPPRLNLEEQKVIMDKIKQIAELLPKSGRRSYAYMPPEIKNLVDRTTKELLQSPVYYDALERYDFAVQSMTKQYTFQEESIQKATEKARADLEKRLSQIVLKAAFESKRHTYKTVQPGKAVIVRDELVKAMGKPEQNLPEQVATTIVRTMKQAGVDEHEQRYLMTDWLRKADLQMTSERVLDIVDTVNTKEPVAGELDQDSLVKSYQLVANVMKLAGRADETVQKFLSERLDPAAAAHVQQETQKLLKNVTIKPLSIVEWGKIKELFHLKSAYPWSETETQIALGEHKQEVINTFRDAIASESKPGYLAFCMTVALKQLNVDQAERASIMHDFAERNDLTPNEIDNILDKITKSQTNFLRKDTWEKINDGLKLLNQPINLTYPWRTDTVIELDPEALQHVLNEIKDTAVALPEGTSIEFVTDKLVQLLKQAEYTTSEMKRFLYEWGVKVGLSAEQVEQIDVQGKRTTDIDVMAKQLDIVDEVKKTVMNFAKVLLAAGMESTQVIAEILAWNSRTELNYDPEKLTEIVGKEIANAEELAYWGQKPYVNKEDYKELARTLQVNVPNMWDKHRDRSPYHKQDPVANVIKDLWKTLWSKLEQERLRTHAQGQMLKQREQQRQQRQMQQEEQEQ